jgi:hypothetical protein
LKTRIVLRAGAGGEAGRGDAHRAAEMGDGARERALGGPRTKIGKRLLDLCDTNSVARADVGSLARDKRDELSQAMLNEQLRLLGYL